MNLFPLISNLFYIYFVPVSVVSNLIISEFANLLTEAAN